MQADSYSELLAGLEALPMLQRRCLSVYSTESEKKLGTGSVRQFCFTLLTWNIILGQSDNESRYFYTHTLTDLFVVEVS